MRFLDPRPFVDKDYSAGYKAGSRVSMKRAIKNLFPLPLFISLGLMLAGQVPAQTFTTLYSFTGDSDGANPVASLILSGNTLDHKVWRQFVWDGVQGQHLWNRFCGPA